MASSEPAALNLRFGQRAATEEAPDVAAFLRPRVRAPAPAPVAPPESIGVIPGSRAVDLEGPLQIFLRGVELDIPAPCELAGLPDLGSWSVRPTTIGWIATVTPPPRRSPGPWRVAQVLAGCIALAIPNAGVAAEGELAVPVSTREPAADQAVEPQPSASMSVSAEPATPAPACAPMAGAVGPAVPVASGRDAVTDAAWEGVDGFDVVLELKGGKTKRGRVGAVQADTFTLIEAESGQVLVLAKSGVASLRVYVPPPIPTKSGVGMLIGGGILTTVGVPVFITGVVFLGVCPSCVYLHLPMLLIGGGALGGGIPMISTGIRRRRAFNKAVEEHRIVPMVSRTREGWSGGLRFRF